MYTYRGEVSRVVDGDTLDMAWVDLGWGVRLHPSPSEPLRLRLAFVNAYETTLRGGTTPEQKALGIECREHLKSCIEGRVVRIRTVRGGDRGSFGRFLVWVWDDGPEDEHLGLEGSYNITIVDRGWGVPYSRGDR